MGFSTGRPPISDRHAAKFRAYADDLFTHCTKMMAEEGDTEKDMWLWRAAVARFFELHAAEQRKPCVLKAQAAGASNELVAYALGLRPQTTLKLYPRPTGGTRWTRRTETKNAAPGDSG